MNSYCLFLSSQPIGSLPDDEEKSRPLTDAKGGDYGDDENRSPGCQTKVIDGGKTCERKELD